MISVSEIMPETDKENEIKEGITVAIRMRPLNRVEGDKQRMWKVLPKYNSVTQTTNTGKPLSERVTGRTFFTFDKVFGEDVDTTNVYDSVAKNIVSSVVDGLNGTVFAYGQTSSGKTYTMQGSGSIQDGAASEGGLVHMAARDIFTQIQSQPDRMFLVRASFLEIYNEEVRDLLGNTSQTLQIREDPRRGVFVHSQEEMVTDFESLLKILFQGEKSRAIASTGMNERSSRSHTIFRITIESRETGSESDHDDDEYSSSSGDGAVRVSTLNLVDLAGSESVRHTGATGERQKEGGMINQSLLTLSRVIVALGQPNQMHINFRDSKLTRILQPSLSGNARMAVICCATPSEMYLEETRSTLQFASRAKLVKTNAQVNEVLDDRSIIRRLQRELAEARGQKTGPGTEHLRELENKAASAIEANAKLNRLKASILNASYLFGGKWLLEEGDNQVESSKTTQGDRSRKRRQSDGGAALLGSSTPSKTFDKTVESPRTAPRKKKEKKCHPPLSPQSELSILRQALSSRAELSRSLRESLENNSRRLCEKENEIETLVSQNDGLADEKERAFTQLANTEETLASVQANLDATMTEYDTLLVEKEKTIVDAFKKVEAENNDVTRLTEENSSLSDRLSELQQRFDALQEERVRSAFDLAQSTEDREKLQAEQEKYRSTIQEMNRKIGELTTTANDAENERKASEEIVSDLQEQLSIASQERNETLEELAMLKTDLAAARSELEEESKSAKTCKEEMETRLKSVADEKEAASAQVTELEHALQNAEAAMTELQNSASDDATRLRSEGDTLKNTISELKQQLESTTAEKSDAYDRISVLEEDNSASEAKLADAVKKIGEMESAASENHATTERLVSELQEQLGSVTSEKAAADDRAKLLEDEIKQLEQELTAALEKESESSATLKDERVTMEAALNDLREHLETSTAETNAACERSAELEGKLVRIEAELSASQAEICQVRDDAKHATEEAQTTIENLQNQVKEVREERDKALTQSDVQQQELEWMNSDLERTQAELEKLSNNAAADREESTRVISELEDKLSCTKSESTVLEGQLSAQKEEAKNLENRLADVRSEKEKLEKLSQDQQEKLELAVVAKDGVLAELSSLQDELTAKERDTEAAQSSAADLYASVADLENKCKALDDDLSSSHAREASLKEGFEALQIEHADTCQHIEQLELEVAASESALDNSKEEYDRQAAHLESTYSELQAVQSELQATVEEKEQEEQMMRARTSSLEARIGNLEAENAGAREEAESQIAKLKDSLSSLESDLSSSKARIEQLENEKDSLYAESQESLQYYQCELTEMQSLLASTRQENESLHEEISAVQSNCVSLRTQVTAKEIEKSDFVNKVGTLNNELEAARSECVALESELEVLQQKKASLMKELESMREKSRHAEADLKTAISSKQESIANHEQKNTELEAKNETLQDSLKESQISHRALEERISALEQGKSTLLSENESLHERLELLNEEKGELDKFLSATEQDVNRLKEQKSTLESNFASVQETLENAKHELLQSKESISKLEEESARESEEKSRLLVELETSKNRRQQEISTMEEELYELREKRTEFESAIDDYNQTIAELKTKNQKCNDCLASYDAGKIKMESRIMSLEEEKNAILAETDSFQVRHKDKMKELEDKIAERDKNIQILIAEKDQLTEKFEQYREDYDKLKEDFKALELLKADQDGSTAKLRSGLENTEQKLLECRTNLTSLQEEKSALQEQFESLAAEKSSIASEVGNLQMQYDEISNSLQGCESDLESTRSSRDHALSAARDREKERDEAVSALEQSYEKNQELVRKLANALPIEKEADLQKQISELKQSNVELKQLLTSANGSEERLRERVGSTEMELKSKKRDLEDAQYRLSQLEEELRQSELAFEEKLSLGVECQDEGIAKELESLREVVNHERAEHEKALSDLKKQMGDEQRVLMQEGETMMKDLRTRAEDLEKRLADSEQEAYNSRHQLEKFRDQKYAAEKNCRELQSQLEKLNSTISHKESSSASLEAELKKARAESYSLKENEVELKDKLCRVTADVEGLKHQKDTATSEVALLKRQMTNVERIKGQLQAECDRLKTKLRLSAENDSQSQQYSVQIKDLQETVDGKNSTIKMLEETISKLRADEKIDRNYAGNEMLTKEAKQLKIKIREKDQRIKKLEAVKLTKEFAEEHKQLKKDNKSLRSQVAELQHHLSTANSDSALRTELSELRFDKEALESKLKKFATHCQRLEDDKAAIATTLRSCNIDTKKHGDDINEAVIALCDKVTSLEDIESVRSRHSSNDNESENAELQAKLDHLVSSEERLNEQVCRYEAEIEDLRKKVKEMTENQSGSTSENSETSRKLRYLEQENLQLMLDVKTSKKQLQAAREEIEVLRMNAMDNSTLDFGTVDLGSDSSQISKPKSSTAQSRSGSSQISKPTKSSTAQSRDPSKAQVSRNPLQDKTNSRSSTCDSDGSDKNQVGKLPNANSGMGRPKAPGLGEAAVQGDETGECTQS